MNNGPVAPDLSPYEEATYLLKVYEGPRALADCLSMLNHQFGVIQSRSELLLTLCTLSLTITGFSGPKIAASGEFARYSMAAGIIMVLLSAIVILVGILRVRWTTQSQGKNEVLTLQTIICYRNEKTRFFQISLVILVIGLSCYVASVVAYLVIGVPPSLTVPASSPRLL